MGIHHSKITDPTAERSPGGAAPAPPDDVLSSTSMTLTPAERGAQALADRAADLVPEAALRPKFGVADDLRHGAEVLRQGIGDFDALVRFLDGFSAAATIADDTTEKTTKPTSDSSSSSPAAPAFRYRGEVQQVFCKLDRALNSLREDLLQLGRSYEDDDDQRSRRHRREFGVERLRLLFGCFRLLLLRLRDVIVISVEEVARGGGGCGRRRRRLDLDDPQLAVIVGDLIIVRKALEGQVWAEWSDCIRNSRDLDGTRQVFTVSLEDSLATRTAVIRDWEIAVQRRCSSSWCCD